MLERLWTSILEIVAQFVTPDWGKLIGLIPVGIAIFIVYVLLRTFRGLAKAPPKRRGPLPRERATPAGIHMPGPSFAPIFGAIGLGLLFLGLVFGGAILWLGAIALILTLLYWLAEGLRIYDHDLHVNTVTVLPPVVHDGPPPGVHMPGPSYRPILGALGVFLLFVGFVFGGYLLLAGVIALIATLVGWLADARQEYVKRVEADRTGHLSNIPDPTPPSRLIGALAVLVIGAIFLQTTVFATNPANGGTGPSAPPAAGGGAAPSGGTGGSGGAPSGAPAPSGPAADVTVQAKNVQFVTTTFDAPANKAFTIAFDNEDPGTAHDIALTDSGGKQVFKGDAFAGVATKTYDVPALPAGAYTFVCTIHPTMTGTATLK